MDQAHQQPPVQPPPHAMHMVQPLIPPPTTHLIPAYANGTQTAELDTLRRNLQSLRDSLDAFHISIRQAMQYPGGPAMSWPELLAKFNVLVARLASIQDELVSRQLGGAHKHPSTDANLAQNPLALDNSVLRRTIVYPVRPTTTDQERQVLPVLLKSMLLPDISKEDTALLEQLQEIEGEGAAPSSGTATTTVVEGQLARRRANVNRLDTLYRDLGNYMDELVRDSKASLHARVEIQNPYAVAAEAAQRRRDAMQKAVATLWKSPNSPQSAAATAASTSSGISGDTVEGTLMFLSGRV